MSLGACVLSVEEPVALVRVLPAGLGETALAGRRCVRTSARLLNIPFDAGVADEVLAEEAHCLDVLR